MGNQDLYRRNPARDIEAYAVVAVGSWLSDRGTVVDTSAGHGPDFRIDYNDGRVGIGEVGWHQDPVIQQMWKATTARAEHQTVRLHPGAGQWAVGLVRGAHIGRLYESLPAFIEHLAALGCHSLHVDSRQPRDATGNEAHRLGLAYVRRVNTGIRDVAIFFMPGNGGVVPTDPDVIVDWIDAMLATPEYADTTTKLLGPEADERHVFLMTGELTPHGVDERLRSLRRALPRRAPTVPSPISHVWVVSRFGDGELGLWTEANGWSAVAPPD